MLDLVGFRDSSQTCKQVMQSHKTGIGVVQCLSRCKSDAAGRRCLQVVCYYATNREAVTALHLKQVCILECSTASGLDSNAGSLPLLIFRALVQVLGFDEVYTLINARCLKLHKV